MQPSGLLHIGNYVGALKNWVKLQDVYDCYYCVADWHALTSNYSQPALIKNYSQDLLINFIAAGLDPNKCTVFLQSKVIEHAELHLLLSMMTPLGWLERVPTYKEKQNEIHDKDLNTYGFLGYPVLQAADILIYRAKHVPVGVDQVPHLEFAREIARRFNFLYNTTVMVEPEPLLTEFPKVVGVDGRKMSKSYDNAVYLSDSREVVEKKIKTMMTDPARKRKTDKGDPEQSPVYALHKVFSTKEEQTLVADSCRAASFGCLDCKSILLQNIFKVMEPIWEKRRELESAPLKLSGIIEAGNIKAQKAASETMEIVRNVMNFA
ncbi:MAG: tryptophan--tRNA ligase [Nitrospirae bacterium]|nr:tryptophan--tRNA ligase [Nitrospirota bacterium]MBF0533913.1 tryptophan--tRNA ligase [Nitrospirota bacterium]MBF0615378.1 tryptophan--tRNA ligase [Nitrospirota bacterium]